MGTFIFSLERGAKESNGLAANCLKNHQNRFTRDFFDLASVSHKLSDNLKI